MQYRGMTLSYFTVISCNGLFFFLHHLGVNSFSLQFGPVEPVPGSLLFAETKLIFTCAPNATWADPGDSNVPFPPNITYTETGPARQVKSFEI